MQIPERRIIAIDPSNLHSAFVVMNDRCQISHKGIVDNDEVVSLIHNSPITTEIVIEGIQSYGMPVGADVFDTVFWIGIFYKTSIDVGIMPAKLLRTTIKGAICHDSRAKDSNIRAALIERFGKTGTKKLPNPYYNDSIVKMKADIWSALAVGLTYLEANEGCRKFISK